MTGLLWLFFSLFATSKMVEIVKKKKLCNYNASIIKLEADQQTYKLLNTKIGSNLTAKISSYCCSHVASAVEEQRQRTEERLKLFL